MTSPATTPNEPAPSTTMAVLDDGKPYELFDVLEIVDGIARVRTPFLFEIGEELKVRVHAAGETFEALAKVRAHVGPPEMRITELELSERKVVSG